MELRMTRKMKKNSFIQIRASSERKAAILAKAREAGLSVTDLIDQALDRTRVWSPENKQVARERLVQLARIGNNLNQLARWCNAHKSGADALAVVAHLKAIEDALKKCI